MRIRATTMPLLLAVTCVLSGCGGASGIAAQPVQDAATHIADSVAAGRAAHAKCLADKTNCDQVDQAFDLIGKDAEGLKELSKRKS